MERGRPASIRMALIFICIRRTEMPLRIKMVGRFATIMTMALVSQRRAVLFLTGSFHSARCRAATFLFMSACPDISSSLCLVRFSS